MRNAVFLDIGGHEGQTVQTVLDPNWAFSHIYTVEPDPKYVAFLSRKFATEIAAGKVTVLPFALGREDRDGRLFDYNAAGGSTIVPGLLADESKAIDVRVVDINRFIASLPRDADIYIKINCEGAEVEIIERLAEIADVGNIRSIMVDFDIVKSSGGYWTKLKTMKLANRRGLPVQLAEDVMIGKSHRQRIENWLSYHPEISRAPRKPRVKKFAHRVRDTLRNVRSAVGISRRGYK